MYTYCEIQWIDDESSMWVTIKADDGMDDRDDEIFFYGLTREQLLEACKNGDILEGEWRVTYVGETTDILA